ncbi:NADPH oxidase organizer 1a [Genypterus blacodes]|uniref:NADPH oxidase organizer 1a n=1 Tax=Genypterus blacodes TaxID=154954 RepID=UPI003F75EC86
MEAQRYPISVRLIGVLHKERSKMFMTSVLWSDEDDIVIYRSFRDFKKMHKKIKKQFPSANPLKKSDRVVPRFRDKTMKSSRPRKGPGKSLVRLTFLQNYCNDLLSCEPQVTQSSNLIEFLQPKAQDLQPDFSKNSIMIMPTDDDIGGGGSHGNGGGNVTQPFVTETYRCVAAYETKDTKNKPFKVVMDEKVDVLIKDKAGWWLVENEDKRLAWFPAPYLERLDDDGEWEEEDNIDGASGKVSLYTAIKSYKAAKSDEISVSIGSVVEVLQKSDNGWWLIRYNGKAGYIPTMFLQSFNNPHAHMVALQTTRHSTVQLQVPSSTMAQSHQLSLSQGNLLKMPAVGSSKQRSHSLDVLSFDPPAYPSASSSTSPTRAEPRRASATPHPLPVIKVEMDGEERSEGSEGSFSSDSSFGLSDDLGHSSASSLSWSQDNLDMRLSRTPPPMTSTHLSPTSGMGGKILPSVSDPNLYKSSTTPKVPPRPQAQEILSRCTTITRKNASRGGLSPSPTEIQSR